jgi:hypothetical protein
MHRTKSGWIELLGKWGHGRAADRDYDNMPAVITDDDGDGHYSAWKVDGSMRDAALILGRFLTRNDGRYVATFSGSTVRAEPTPDDFWIEDGDDFKPNLAAYPEVVAW